MAQAPLLSVNSGKLLSVIQAAKDGELPVLTGLVEGQSAFIASLLARTGGLRVLLVTANDLRANTAAADAMPLLAEQSACLPGGEIDLTRGASSHESSWRRLEALSACAEGKITLLTVSMDALMQRMAVPEPFRQAIRRIRPGEVLPPKDLIADLVHLGYERVEIVEGRGQCALRGAILDVFPTGAASPIRIEYFDDEIDSIRAFDCLSQRSADNLPEALIPPATEVILPGDEAGRAAERMRSALNTMAPEAPENLFADLPPLPEDEAEDEAWYDRADAPKARKASAAVRQKADLDSRMAALLEDAQLVEEGLPFRRIKAWLPVLTDHTATLLDWYQPELIVLTEPDRLRERADERHKGFSEDLASAMERGEAVAAQEDLLLSWEELTASMAAFPRVLLSDLSRGMGGFQTQTVISLDCEPLTGYHGQIRPLAADLQSWLDKKWRVALLSGGVARGQRLQTTLEENGVHAVFYETPPEGLQTGIAILPESMSHGFIWQEEGLVVCSDTDIWGDGYRKSKSRRNAGEKIAAFTDLKPGDYVVHENHGVAIYQGTARITTEGTSRDYLLLQYAGTDKLYVPIDQLQRVQRYIGNPNQPPKLNRLGGGEWDRQKGKVKEGLKKLAFDLVELYARREKTNGHAFSPDTPWQREFEDQFPYELTPDQEQSVREIFADMESPRNMDRLLVGDVGYGKTEVSLRAAFKAVVEGKQVAILAPTTILAQQHFHTVQKRFASFPVHADVLSRFRTAKEQRQVLSDLAAGRIDILVGTHRMLAKDVAFKDLGLLIVDEEQRFGVQHKEVIKNLKNQVDVLTLSATPIPRTLHMSMVGIRDMSVLETPPEDRLPVQTRVVEYSDALVRDAILRELSRGGQVYFLYNRVRSIESFYQRLRQLVPEARIGVAHGQMRENGLEDVMMDFYAGSYDVLLCTTIIESGLDVPTANTLIVFDAERFGLSQLYQLRGRVGRSSRQAYALFTVRRDKALSETAEQRLAAIREFTEFGAGFRIAMRDLEIRGAGNILGPEQHGHLETVGYEMYCKLMEETLSEAKGEVLHSELETRIDLHVDAYLPKDYIADEFQRMEMYKRIAGVSTDAEREDVIDELVDRFGETPPVVDALLDVSQLRALCNRAGISQVMMRGGALTMRLDGRYIPDPMAFINAAKETEPKLAFVRAPKEAMVLNGKWHSEADVLKVAIRMMKRICARLDEMKLAEKEEKTEGNAQ